MTLKFNKPLVIGGDGEWKTAPFKFGGLLKIGGSGSSPSWRDIILSGNTALTLTNAKTNGLNYVKLFGACEQNGTPTPSVPAPIMCNNGEIKYGQHGKNLFDPKNFEQFKQSDGTYRATGVGNKRMYIPAELVGKTLTFSCNIDLTKEPSPSAVRVFASINKVSSQGNNIYPNEVRNSHITFTPVSTDDYIGITYGSFGGNYFTFYDVQLEEGSTVTDYEPYHFGFHTDGTPETVELTGKNLLNPATCTPGRYVYTNGTILSSSTYGMSDYIPVLKGRAYVTSGISATNLSVYDSSKNFIERRSNKNFVAEFDGYVILNYVLTDTNMQFEEGTTATDYEPYYSGGSATATNLFAIGESKDEQEVLTGTITRNVGIKVLDGTEDWALDSGTRFYIPIFDNLYRPTTVSYCTHYKGIPTNSSFNSYSGEYVVRVGHSTNSNWHNRLVIQSVEYITVENFKQYLASQYQAGTPIIIVYPLAEPTTESIKPQPLTTQAGTNVITAEGSIEDLELEVSYKGYSVAERE